MKGSSPGSRMEPKSSSKPTGRTTGSRIWSAASASSGIDVFVILCTGHFHGLNELAPGSIVVPAGPVVDHGLAAIAESATAIGVLLPNEGQKESFRCEPAGNRRFVLSHASPYSGDRWETAARELEESDLVVMHCMGYTEPMRRKLAQETGKPVLLARRMVAAAVAQVL